MRKILLVILILLPVFSARARAPKQTRAMGVSTGADSTKFSHRSLDKKLFMPQRLWGAGIQATILSMSAEDSDVMLVLTGIDGGCSLTRLSLNGSYAYIDNQAIGLRVTYLNAKGNLGGASIDLLNDGLSFNVSDLSASANSFSASIFNRSYFGLDRRGIVALFCEVSLSYTYSKLESKLLAQGASVTDRVNLGFAPGVEVFATNNLSLSLSIGLADIGYTWSRSLRDNRNTGNLGGFNAKARLSLSNLNFGLNFYF